MDATQEYSDTDSIERPLVRETNYDLLYQARLYWNAMEDTRARRARVRDYYRNKPNEVYKDPDTGLMVREEDAIKASGRIPYKMNMMRSILKNLIGQFRSNKTQRMAFPRNREDNEAADQMTEALRYACDVNRTDEIDVQELEESFIGGLYGWKTGCKWNEELGRHEISVDVIQPTRIFFNRDLSDKRMQELRLIGEIFDMPLPDVVSQFAQTKADEKFLRDLYLSRGNQYLDNPAYDGFQREDAIGFDYPTDPNMCRVIEVWVKEFRWKKYAHDRVHATYDETQFTTAEINELNMRRRIEAEIMGTEAPPEIEVMEKPVSVWTVYYLTPEGIVLHKKDTPFWHKSHPYTIGMASFLDGEIWGLLEDVIDSQRLINRITAAIDYMFGASAKGVLLVDEKMIPEGVKIEDFADQWTKFNGVIAYRAIPNNPTAIPQQITANSIPAGMFNWLGTVQSQMKDVSGVQGASTGADPNSGTPASLYNQQVIQAQVTNRDYFDSFFESRKQRDMKIIKLIMQYYDEPIFIATAGKRADGTKIIRFSPKRVEGLDFDVNLTDTADTPATRQLMEETLMKLMDSNRITFRQWLQMSSHPKADMIERIVEKTNPLLAQANIGGDPMQQVQQSMSQTQVDPSGQMIPGQQQPQDPTQQLMMQFQQQAQAGDPDAIATLNQLQ